MYNKVRKALNNMGYIFKEFDKVEFSNGNRIGNVLVLKDA